MKKKKGSITVYLLLLFSVFLLLACAFFYSLRVRGAQVQVQAGTRAALYSVFARYDRELWEKYDLLFLNGACGMDSFAPGVLAQQLKQTAGVPWGMAKTDGLSASNIWRLGEPAIAITGYTLVTDQNGEAFYREAVEAAKDGITASALSLLKSYILGEDTLEEKSQDITSIEAVMDTVEEAKEQAAADLLTGEEPADGADAEAVNVEKKKNPLETIRRVQKMGLLAVVLPEDAQLSSAEYAVSALPSKRTVSTGVGLSEAALPHTVSDRLYFTHYMAEHFSCFTDQAGKKAVSCELEYLLGGKNSDKKNLEQAVKKLLLIREASNLLYLEGDAASRESIRTMAIGLCSVLGMPMAEEVLTQALLICWAYGESIMDVRNLLSGGKVPLVKTADTWMLTLKQLSEPEGLLDGKRALGKKGLTYKQYLETLLYAGSEEVQIRRSMDLIEINIKTMEGKGSFRIDNCIYKLQIRVEVPLAGAMPVTVTEERSYAD